MISSTSFSINNMNYSSLNTQSLCGDFNYILLNSTGNIPDSEFSLYYTSDRSNILINVNSVNYSTRCNTTVNLNLVGSYSG